MTQHRTKIFASLVITTALSACGGGGGLTDGTGSNGGQGAGGGSGTTGGDSTSGSGPASTDIVDLIAFADAGSRTEMRFRDNTANGWDRSRNCEGDACVIVDRIPGAEGAGLVIYRAGPDVFVYDVFGSELATMATPTGIYNGLLTANYRVGPDGDWIATVGQMNLWLDMADATVAVGGILPYASANGVENSSIQFFGDADVVGGKFTDTDLRVLVNAGSPTFFETTATTSGLLVSGDDGSAILGTVEVTGDPDLLLLQGGYLSAHDPRF